MRQDYTVVTLDIIIQSGVDDSIEVIDDSISSWI
jgi:hypothetical protein